MEMTLKGMMKAESSAFLEDTGSNKANGYRPGRVCGYGKLLELRIPRDRHGEFLSQVWTLHRRNTVQNEAYVVLGVTEDGRREVLAISHQPVESATGWQMMGEQLRRRECAAKINRNLPWKRNLSAEKYPNSTMKTICFRLRLIRSDQS